MQTFRWTKALATGIDDVDAQHRGLLDILNRLAQLESGGHPDIDAGEAVRALGLYAREHFDLEVRMMQAASCDLRHVVKHVHEHEEFMRHVSLAGESLRAGDTEVGHELAAYLALWLRQHIMGVDQIMATQLRLIQDGVPGAEAYERVVLGREAAA